MITGTRPRTPIDRTGEATPRGRRGASRPGWRTNDGGADASGRRWAMGPAGLDAAAGGGRLRCDRGAVDRALPRPALLPGRDDRAVPGCRRGPRLVARPDDAADHRGLPEGPAHRQGHDRRRGHRPGRGDGAWHPRLQQPGAREPDRGRRRGGCPDPRAPQAGPHQRAAAPGRPVASRRPTGRAPVGQDGRDRGPRPDRLQRRAPAADLGRPAPGRRSVR